MNKQLLQDSIGWGMLLWLFGYALGILFFPVLPVNLIGWFIMPLGLLLTLWVLKTKIKQKQFSHYIVLSVAWTLIAVVFDYYFLVKVFHPSDGYYKLDVYLYYFLTFTVPLAIGFQKTSKT